MKRGGRQHGMVRAYEMLSLPGNPRPRRKIINEISSPPTAALFTRVSTKPTNHSKYTGKCGRPRCRGCHSHPVCKSMDKVKGANKVRSPAAQDLKFYGFSAAGVLNYLDRVDRDEDGTNCDDDDEEEADVVEVSCNSALVVEIHEEVVADGFDVDNLAVDDDDGMGFCEVGLIWAQTDDGDESWCLIDEI